MISGAKLLLHMFLVSVCSSDLTPINIGRIVKGSRGLFVSSTELLVTQPTALGVNDTNVAELSRALQSSLSLDANTELSQPNARVESPPRVSSEVHADEHEKRNLIEAKVPPAVSGGTGPIANTSLCHGIHSEKVITPTATWPPKQDPQSKIAGGLSEEPACLTQTVKSREADKKDDFPKEVQLELESPPDLLERMKILEGKMRVRSKHWR